MTVHGVPAGYEWPGMVDDPGVLFYLAPDPEGIATPLFMVMAVDGEGLRILAERCHLKDGVRIVNALRLAKKLQHDDQRVRGST